MTEMQLRAGVFEDLNAILDNEEAMKKLRKFLSRLRKETIGTATEKKPEPYTTKETNARPDADEADDEADHLIPHDEVMQDIREALRELKLVKQGKLKSRPVEDLLNEI